MKTELDVYITTSTSNIPKFLSSNNVVEPVATNIDPSSWESTNFDDGMDYTFCLKLTSQRSIPKCPSNLIPNNEKSKNTAFKHHSTKIAHKAIKVKQHQNPILKAHDGYNDQNVPEYDVEDEEHSVFDNISGEKYDYAQNPNILVEKKSSSKSKTAAKLGLWYLWFGVPLSELVNENDRILYESKIFKYKPGYSTWYVERWMQITSNGNIRVYKNRFQSVYNVK